MPMFYTPKPRQFHYNPRYYNPEKERWEALKQKYADNHPHEEKVQEVADTSDKELQYFERRVREIDGEEKKKGSRLTWKDLFRKREVPQFHYTPRFAGAEENTESRQTNKVTDYKKRNIKIKRRYDISDEEYLKPIPATKIMLYTLLVCLLLYWILF